MSSPSLSGNAAVFQVHRTSDNHRTYESITLNGATSTLNWTFEKGPSPAWYGLTVNFQVDGNYQQNAYKMYFDNLTLTYRMIGLSAPAGGPAVDAEPKGERALPSAFRGARARSHRVGMNTSIAWHDRRDWDDHDHDRD